MDAGKLTVVLDTNVILSSIGDKSPTKLILKSLADGLYHAAYSSEILLEYEEQLLAKFNSKLAVTFINFLLTSPHTIPTEIHFQWQLIYLDQDDNKFVDAALASNADHLITNDKHFNVLKQLPFPKISVISGQIFNQMISNQIQPN